MKMIDKIMALLMGKEIGLAVAILRLALKAFKKINDPENTELSKLVTIVYKEVPEVMKVTMTETELLILVQKAIPFILALKAAASK